MTAFNVDKTDINLESIDRHLRQLMDLNRATSYAKQKDSLRKEFETFFASLPGHITLATVTPRDICRFLVFFKTRTGKLRFTAMAVNTSAKRDDILVDVLYVYKTVDSYNGKLRAILHSMRRDGE